ncbi:MAG: T9SS type A sorting domain-containing protein [Bacteroidetes bacterium]|nr:T9SS type A sorting domain-containing protein [Bacteroidota bacterium]
MKKTLHYGAIALAFSLGLSAQTSRKIAKTQSMPVNQISKVSYQFKNRGCATAIPSSQWEQLFQKKMQEYKNAMQNGKVQSPTVTIPVIVHVIHTGQAVGSFPNLSQAQINSQITVLNQDYAGNGYGVGSLPAVFAPAKANTGLNFCLALKDSLGNVLTEPGIDRVNANNITASLGSFPSKDPSNSSYNSPSTFQSFIDGYIKPNTIWNPTRYMNIWLTDENGSVGLLGFGTFPVLTGTTLIGNVTPGGDGATDGLWCWAKSFGSVNIYPSGTYDPTYNMGRTASHEIGHWVGLRHVWGDGTCATDFCNDTPPAQQANYGCPTHPHNLGVCAGNTTGEMFQNFMDYTDDNCMSLFTNDQNSRIQTAMAYGIYRNQLAASAVTLCNLASSTPTANFSMPGTACTNSAMPINNSSSGVPLPTYVWSSSPSTGVSFSPNNTAINPSVTFVNPGSYVISLVATNSVGANTSTMAVVVNTCGSTSSSSCSDTLKSMANIDTLTVYTAGTDTATPGCSPNAGFVAGNNCYGDKEKADYFDYSTYSSITSPQITGVIALFYNSGNKGTGGTSPSATVGMKIYQGSNSATAPGTQLGLVNTPLSAIIASPSQSNVTYCGNPSLAFSSAIIKPYKFVFSTPINAPTSGGFFASLVLPTVAGDTAVVFNDRNAATSTAWEMASNNTWYSMYTNWGSSANYKLALLPIIQCSTVTAIGNQNIFQSNISLYPNPTSGNLSVIVTLPNSQTIDITVTNALGQLVSQSKHANITNSVIDLDLRNNVNGIYFVTISNGTEKTVKRVVLNN